jgi:hypothetical protein
MARFQHVRPDIRRLEPALGRRRVRPRSVNTRLTEESTYAPVGNSVATRPGRRRPVAAPSPRSPVVSTQAADKCRNVGDATANAIFTLSVPNDATGRVRRLEGVQNRSSIDPLRGREETCPLRCQRAGRLGVLPRPIPANPARETEFTGRVGKLGELNRMESWTRGAACFRPENSMSRMVSCVASLALTREIGHNILRDRGLPP